MTATDGLRYIDSDGHILEHPTAMPAYAPAKYRDRIWHVETDGDGEEWAMYNGDRTSANIRAAAGTAGCSDEDRAVRRGEVRYTETRPAAGTRRPGSRTWTRTRSTCPCCIRPCCLASRASATLTSPRPRPAPTTTGARTTCRRARAGCSAPAPCRRCTDAEDVARVAAEIRRVAELPGMVSVFMRPNPTVDWQPFNDPDYDPVWQAADETGLPIALPSVPRPRPARCMHRSAPEPAAPARSAPMSTISTPTARSTS